MMALCPTKEFPLQRHPWATCDGGRPNRQRRGQECARRRNSGRTVCRYGSARRPRHLVRLQHLVHAHHPQHLQSGRRRKIVCF